jgi:Caspase domain
MDLALLVGINAYPGSPLLGCIHDVDDVIAFLQRRLGFPPDYLVSLCDSAATRAEILRQLEGVASALAAGDRFILYYYSGHGTRVPRTLPGEAARVEEAVCPVDFAWQGLDAMNAILPADPGRIFATVPDGVEWEGPVRRISEVPAPGYRIGLIAACNEDETAAETDFDGRANGAFTYHLLRCLDQNAGASLSSLAGLLATPLRPFHQTPQTKGDATIVARNFLSS